MPLSAYDGRARRSPYLRPDALRAAIFVPCGFLRAPAHLLLRPDQPEPEIRNDYNRSLFDLKYATRAGSAPWILVTIDSRGNVGRWTSIAVDATYSPHISYFDESNLDLKYARGVQ